MMASIDGSKESWMKFLLASSSVLPFLFTLSLSFALTHPLISFTSLFLCLDTNYFLDDLHISLYYLEVEKKKLSFLTAPFQK